MSPMRLIILAVAAIAAVMAAFLVRNLANQPAPQAQVTTEQVEKIVEVEVSQMKVLAVNQDVRVGTLLTPDEFSWIDWPEATVNPMFYTQDTTPEAMETLAGSVVRTPMYENEPVHPSKIVEKGATGFMAALLSPGKRAVSVEISPESASAGFILPDDKVDIILTQEIEFQNGASLETRTVTQTILENVRILAIDQTFGDVDGIPTMTGSTATMELLPQHTELVAQAARTGSLSLTLRSHADADFNEGQAVQTVESIGEGDAGAGRIKVYRNGNVTVGGS